VSTKITPEDKQLGNSNVQMEHSSASIFAVEEHGVGSISTKAKIAAKIPSTSSFLMGKYLSMWWIYMVRLNPKNLLLGKTRTRS
jgi:hypothetical protein